MYLHVYLLLARWFLTNTFHKKYQVPFYFSDLRAFLVLDPMYFIKTSSFKNYKRKKAQPVNNAHIANEHSLNS